MKKKLLLSIISTGVVASVLMFTENTAHTFPVVPPTFNAGAPGQSSCGGPGCHSTNDVNTGTGSTVIGFGDGAAEYQAGTTYPMTVTISQTGAKRFGFQLCALDADGNSVGTLNATGANTKTQSGAGIDFVNHNNAVVTNDTKTYAFEWTAPATTTGTITFYVSGMAANNATGSLGDFVYTTNSEIEPKVSSDLTQIDGKTWGFYPNPAQNQLNIVLPANSGIANVFAIDGKLAQTFALQSGNNTVDLTLNPGVYILEVQAQNGENYTERLIIE